MVSTGEDGREMFGTSQNAIYDEKSAVYRHRWASLFFQATITSLPIQKLKMLKVTSLLLQRQITCNGRFVTPQNSYFVTVIKGKY